MGALKREAKSGEESASMIVTCYIEGRRNQWEGVCLDFDLAVHGSSFHDIEQKLDSAIHEYLAYVSELPEKDRKRLLNRQVPLGARLGFLARIFVSWIFRPRDRNGKHWNAYTHLCSA
jgi:hypothetical protein